jgi:hypothetical protein
VGKWDGDAFVVNTRRLRLLPDTDVIEHICLEDEKTWRTCRNYTRAVFGVITKASEAPA